MEWISPYLGLMAGAVGAGLLIALYFLKLKRTEQLISCTLLWKRAVQDLQVNAPFQRLRRNLLLLLQLLAMLAMALALAGPVMSLVRGPGKPYVILIDRSASMRATDVAPNRLEEAKRQARAFVETLRNRATFSLQDTADQAMVIAFDDRCKVMSNFTSDKRQLLAAIDAIEPGDGRSQLAESLMVARAFAQSAGEEANNRSAKDPAELILFSDGRIADQDQIAVGADELRYYPIGTAGDNVAVTAMQARRSYENPEQVSVFATLSNFGTTAIPCQVQIAVNENVRQVQSRTLPPMTTEGEPPKPKPGRTTIQFELTHAGAGVVELRHTASDVLEVDNAAWAIVLPPRNVRVLLVTAGNPAVESALKACPIERLEICTGEQFDAMDPAAMNAQPIYDVIILDGHTPKVLPRAAYIVFGKPPEGIDVATATEPLTNQSIMDWRGQHAILRYVNLVNLFVGKAWRMTAPRDAQVLAEFRDSPAILTLRRGGNQFLLVGFDVLETNWPFEPGFILFWYNALDYLGSQTGDPTRVNLSTGDPIVADGLEPETKALIRGPDGKTSALSSGSGGTLRWPQTDRAGVYTMELSSRDIRAFAVNLLDERESEIAPVREMILAGQPVAAPDSPVGRANTALWPWIVLVVLGIVCGEWWVYNSKIRL